MPALIRTNIRRRVQFEQPECFGPRAITDSLNRQPAPVLQTSTVCTSALAFPDLASGRDNAFLIALQLQACPDDQGSELFVDHLAMALATHVAHTYGGMRARSDAKMGTLARWQERRAKELLVANLTGGITLADLANACKLSIRHFTRAFRGSTGMSPQGWLLHLRIEKAKGLLTSSRCMLADIALDCGFADQSHFTRRFQRSVGVSPGAWRRLYQC